MYSASQRQPSLSIPNTMTVAGLSSPSDALSQLRRSEGAIRVYRKRQTIYLPGDATGSMYEVLHGSLFIYSMIDDGRRQIVDLIHPGEFFGFATGRVHLSGCETF